MKTALLLALVSFKKGRGSAGIFGCLEFGPGLSDVVLRPRFGYVPKIPITLFVDQVVNLQVLPLEEADPALAFLGTYVLYIVMWTKSKSLGPQSSSLFDMEASRRGRLSPR